MKYIVLDLEWNQSNAGKEAEVEGLPFEIIEIGAIKLSEDGDVLGEFSELIRPQVYRQMHAITSRLIHLQMRELERGKPFAEVAGRFLEWCGEDYRFCTWGNADLTELQRNMNYHNMTPVSSGPIPFWDVQKLFSIQYEDRKARRALETAVDMLEIEKDIPFHRAFSDAYYTAKVFIRTMRDNPDVLKNISFDVYHIPQKRGDEIKVQFDTYAKYISRGFPDKIAAFADMEVNSCRCYLCNRNLRKKIKWFTPNGRNYYCMAYCEKHGYLKSKARLRKTDEGKTYVVKTTKLISEESAADLQERKKKAQEQKKRQNRRMD